MPYKDRARHKLVMRASKRAKRHGPDWRGFVWKYGFACANILEDGCLVDKALEFHHPLDGTWEDYDNTRVLLCKECHRKMHNGGFSRARGYDALVAEDCEKEMELCGGMWAWVKRYNVGRSLPEGERPVMPLKLFV